MGWLEEKIAKWARLIDEHAGPGISERVLEGHENLAEVSPEERAAWSRLAMERLAEAVADVATREKIMEGRACVFVEEFGEEPLLELRKVSRKPAAWKRSSTPWPATARNTPAPTATATLSSRSKPPATARPSPRPERRRSARRLLPLPAGPRRRGDDAPAGALLLLRRRVV